MKKLFILYIAVFSLLYGCTGAGAIRDSELEYNYSELSLKNDIAEADSAYLCDNIDWSFKVWEEQLWGRNVSFEDFCEYILPYRVGNEALSSWRQDYYKDFNGILDSLRASDGPGLHVKCRYKFI